MERHHTCCLSTLDILTHSDASFGGLAFLDQNQKQFETFTDTMSGQKLGDGIKNFMCPKCQINLRACKVLANQGLNFAKALAHVTKYAVLGNFTGENKIEEWKDDNKKVIKYNWRNAPDSQASSNATSNDLLNVVSQISEPGEDITQVNPDGQTEKIKNSASGVGPWPNPNAKK